MPSILAVYGIKNCDTMQKTFNWFNEHGIKYTFHDYKAAGVTTDKLTAWLEKVTMADLINNKGTTYRNLTDSQKKTLNTPKRSLAIIQQHTSMIKRPLIEYKNHVILGYNPEVWTKLLS